MAPRCYREGGVNFARRAQVKAVQAIANKTPPTITPSEKTPHLAPMVSNELGSPKQTAQGASFFIFSQNHRL